MPTVRTRPKRSRDPIKAAYEVFQEVIGEAPRTELPREKIQKPASRKAGTRRVSALKKKG